VTTQRCRITVSGVLDEADRLAFRDFDIQTVGVHTVLIGELDQPTLGGGQGYARRLPGRSLSTAA
jgi:hypothetical protein